VTIEFRRMTANDLPLFDDWVHRPHVAAWWHPDETTIPETLDAIEGREPSDHHLIVVDGSPVGMIQTYLVSDYPEWDEILAVGEGVAGVDLLIGEPDRIGRGLGPEVLRAFLHDVVFAQAGTRACVAGVEPGNTRSLRAFEKAGFEFVRDYEEDGRPHRLLRLDRSSLAAMN
jgi:aminoglycoside 6'-N-acetyltransferase